MVESESIVEKKYRKTIEEEQIKLPLLKKNIFLFSVLRLLIILTGFFLCYYAWGNNKILLSIISVCVILFLLSLKYQGRLLFKRDYVLTKIELLENEIKSLHHDFSGFDGVAENINSEHDFSYDLDIFGNNSVIQLINRTVTSFGKEFLAGMILSPFQDSSKIIKHQKAVKELTTNQNSIIHFRTLGRRLKAEGWKADKILEILTHKNIFYKNRFWQLLTYIIPATYFVSILLVIMELLPVSIIFILWVFTFVLSIFSLKSTAKVLTVFDKKTEILTTYSTLFKTIEEQEFSSELLKNNQKTLIKKRVSKEIKKLSRYCSNLTIGFTYPAALFFNPVLFWHVNYSIKIEQWLEETKNEIPLWFESLAKFEYLSSLSVFAYNHPTYNYPVPNTDKFIFKGKELGHPLIPTNTCVTNDISITDESSFLIITGANMAGKSTYLRTIGVNQVLACIGAPVFAESLIFPPCSLVTNLRTTDSLVNQESYFFSELKRLKMIIDRLKKGEFLFIILDEILKGTNSEDKQKGSIALMKQLISLKGSGIIATHDLVLGNLEIEYPNHIKNYRFEADITDNELTFTYKLREGVAQNMNATFLMKQMGITGL